MPDPVTDPADVRVLIPRVRRALVGPQGSGFVTSDLNDSDTTAVIADAIADVILYTGSVFGKELEVTERDNYYQSPIAWRTSQALEEHEASVIVLQAALNYIFRLLETLKTSETIRNEGQEWSYTISSQALAERVKELRAARDAALQRVELSGGGVEAWVNLLLVRDQYTDALIEPWIQSGGGGQLLVAAGLEFG